MKAFNLSQMKADNFKIKKIDSDLDIYIVTNFLSTNEQELLYDKVKQLTDDDLKKFYINNKIEGDLIQDPKNDYWFNKVIDLDGIDKILGRQINLRLRKYLQNNYSSSMINGIQRHRGEEFLGYHHDNFHDEKIEFAATIYINDDYEGGELHFLTEKNLDKLKTRNLNDLFKHNPTTAQLTQELGGLSIKPRRGDLVLFPATIEYTHAVWPVRSSDSRYAMVSFISKGE